MSSGGDWDWTGVAAAGTFGGFVALIGRLIHMGGRKDQANIDLNLKVDSTAKEIERISTSLSDYKAEAAGKFVTREALAELKTDIMQRLDRQDDKFDASVNRIVSRIDSAFPLHGK